MSKELKALNAKVNALEHLVLKQNNVLVALIEPRVSMNKLDVLGRALDAYKEALKIIIDDLKPEIEVDG